MDGTGREVALIVTHVLDGLELVVALLSSTDTLGDGSTTELATVRGWNITGETCRLVAHSVKCLCCPYTAWEA